MCKHAGPLNEQDGSSGRFHVDPIQWKQELGHELLG